MDINFKCGYYIQNRLFQISADLNVDKDYYIELKNLLHIKKVKDYDIVRIGLSNKDGGYIMVNNFDFGKIAYSFGICDDVNWDNIMAEMGYNIYMYDHTINSLPYTRKEFHYFKEGIAGTDDVSKPLKTLKHYIERNNHVKEKNMILKMDVEGAEWDFLETVDENTLCQFDQIIFEFHNIVRAGYGNKILNLLKKLNTTHQLIHLHGNNSGYLLTIGDTIFPDVLEATYVNKKNYLIEEDETISLPTLHDAPNDQGRPDVVLGKWNTPIKF